MHLAAQLGNVELLKFLVEDKKMDVNDGTKTGFSPLHLQVFLNVHGAVNYKVLDYLVSKGAKINVNGNSALKFVANKDENHKLVDYLNKNSQ